MASSVRFVPNPQFVEQFERSVEARAEMALAAEVVKGIAERMAPHKSGAYRDAFEIDNQPEGVRLNNTDFKAHWIEFGTVNWPPHATIYRAAQEAGLRVDRAATQRRSAIT